MAYLLCFRRTDPNTLPFSRRSRCLTEKSGFSKLRKEKDVLSERFLKQYITAPARWRDQSLALAKEYGGFLDEVISALKAGQPNERLAGDLLQCKVMLMESLTEAAEYEYQSELNKRALRMLERHRELTAEQAVTIIETYMLEVAVGNDS